MEFYLLASCMELERSQNVQGSAALKVIFLPMRALCLPGTHTHVHHQLTRGRPKAEARDLSRGVFFISTLPRTAPKACLLITPGLNFFMYKFLRGSMNLATRKNLEKSFLVIAAPSHPQVISKEFFSLLN